MDNLLTGGQAVIPKSPLVAPIPKITAGNTSTSSTFRAPATTAPAPASPAGALSTSQQSAYDVLKATLANWGLSDLYNYAVGYLQQGMTTDEITIQLEQTPEYKARFAGNEARKAAGLGTLSPAQYISLEEQYHQVMQSYGLPSGFYDSPSDYAALIGKDVSPAEIDARAKIAHDYYLDAPPEEKSLWQSYGFSTGDVIAGILDPNVATSVIQDRAAQVGIGGAGAAHGFAVSGSRAKQFYQHGVTLDQARNAYTRLQQTYGTDQSIAHRFGTDLTQADEENELLLGDGNVTNKRQSLYNEEAGLFQGGTAVDQQTLSGSQDH